MAGSWDILNLAEIDLFDDDLDLLVHKHHALTLAGIDDFKKQQLDEVQNSSKGQPEEVTSQELDYVEWQCEGMKQAAGNLALVSLISRFIHRIIRLESDMKALLPQKAKKKLKKKSSELISKLRSLDEVLGEQSNLDFFGDLETARNAVVHHDSRVSWFEHRNRHVMVPARYRGADNGVQFDADDLAEAIENCKKQVQGYSKKLRELKKIANK